MNQSSTSTNEATVNALNDLLRGEISAVESYTRALPSAAERPTIQSNLQDCKASHEGRVERLRSAIVQAGGEPAHASGAWGVFAKALASGSRAFGWKIVVKTLEEGEDHGLKEYEEALSRLDAGVQRLVSDELYPQQVHTRGVISALKRNGVA